MTLNFIRPNERTRDSSRLKQLPGTNKLLNQYSRFFQNSLTLNNGSYSGCSLYICLFMPHAHKYLIILRELLPLMMRLMPSWPTIGSSIHHFEGQLLNFMIDAMRITLREDMISLLNIFPLLCVE